MQPRTNNNYFEFWIKIDQLKKKNVLSWTIIQLPWKRPSVSLQVSTTHLVDFATFSGKSNKTFVANTWTLAARWMSHLNLIATLGQHKKLVLGVSGFPPCGDGRSLKMVSGTHAIPIEEYLKTWEWYRKLTIRWSLESPLTTRGATVGKWMHHRDS